jgi:hypothetical protein
MIFAFKFLKFCRQKIQNTIFFSKTGNSELFGMIRDKKSPPKRTINLHFHAIQKKA